MCADTRELRGDVKLCQEFLLTSTTSTLVRWPKEPSRESFGTSRVLPRSWRPTCPNTQFGRLAPSFRTQSYFNISKYWSKIVEIHARFKQDMENSGPEFQVIKICCIHRYFCEYFHPQGRFQAPIRISWTIGHNKTFTFIFWEIPSEKIGQNFWPPWNGFFGIDYHYWTWGNAFWPFLAPWTPGGC